MSDDFDIADSIIGRLAARYPRRYQVSTGVCMMASVATAVTLTLLQCTE